MTSAPKPRTSSASSAGVASAITRRPCSLGQRDHVGAEQPRAPADGERVAARQTEHLQPAQRGEAVHRQRRRLLEAGAVRDRDHRRGGDDEQLGLGAAVGAPRHHAAITSSPSGEPRRPRDRRTRSCPAASMPGVHGGARSATPAWRRPMSVGLTAAAATAIRTSPGPGSRTGAVDDLQDLGTSGLDDADRACHGGQVSGGRRGHRRPGGAGSRSRSSSVRTPSALRASLAASRLGASATPGPGGPTVASVIRTSRKVVWAARLVSSKLAGAAADRHRPAGAAERPHRLGAGLGRHQLQRLLQPLGHRLGQPAHAAQAAGGGHPRRCGQAPRRSSARSRSRSRRPPAAPGSRRSSQPSRGGEHDRVAQRAAQPGLVALGQHVAADVDEHEQVAAQRGRSARRRPSATAAGPPSMATSTVGRSRNAAIRDSAKYTSRPRTRVRGPASSTPGSELPRPVDLAHRPRAGHRIDRPPLPGETADERLGVVVAAHRLRGGQRADDVARRPPCRSPAAAGRPAGSLRRQSPSPAHRARSRRAARRRRRRSSDGRPRRGRAWRRAGPVSGTRSRRRGAPDPGHRR